MNQNLTQESEELIKEINRFIQDKAPRIVETEALNHTQNSFINQGFTDKNLEKWPKRKIPKKKNGKKITGKTLESWKAKNEGRALLIGHSLQTKGTHLKDSITGERSPGKVTVTVDKEYAQVHNDGLAAGRPPGFTMPQRQFIGSSRQMENKIVEKIEKELTKIINKY